MEQAKKSKWIKIGAGVLITLVILMIILMLSIGMIVKGSVQVVLPKITGTPCDIGLCVFNPFEGRVSMNNFRIGNPEGYTEKNAFKLGKLILDVGLSSLTKDKIIIEEITIDNMVVDFEAKLTATNLTTIKSNVDKFTKKDVETKTQGKEKETSGTSKKFQIDKFKFINSKVVVGFGGQTVEVPLADIKIEQIGTSPEGATVGEVANKIFMAIYESASKTAAAQGMHLGDISTGKASELLDSVKGLFGGEKKK
jgi:hypothetical protein